MYLARAELFTVVTKVHFGVKIQQSVVFLEINTKDGITSVSLSGIKADMCTTAGILSGYHFL